MPPDTAKPQQNEEVIDSFKRITTFASDIDLTREISASHTLRIPNTEFLFYSRGSVYFFSLTDNGLLITASNQRSNEL